MWPPSIVPLFLETIRVVALTPDGASLRGRVRTPRGRWPGFAFLEHGDLADTAGPDGKTARRPWDRPRRRLPGPSVSFCHLSWPVGPVTRARSRARRAEGVASTHKGQAGGNRGGGRREAGGAHRLPHAHTGLPRALGLSQDRRQPGPGSQWPRHLPRRPARGLQPAVSPFGAVRACPRLCRLPAKRGLGMRPGRHPTVLTALPA